MTQAFPDREFSGIGGISTFDHALNYFLLGCGTVQVATAAMLDHAIGPNVIRDLTTGMTEFLDRNADRGWTSLADFRGLRRGRVVPHSADRGARMPPATTAGTRRRPRATRPSSPRSRPSAARGPGRPSAAGASVGRPRSLGSAQRMNAQRMNVLRSRLMKRPSPAAPSHCPPSTMTLPRDITTSEPPWTWRPS